MNIGLTQIGAYDRTAALRPVARDAMDRTHAITLRADRTAARPGETRDQVRDQVLAERGLDRMTLAHLGPQARLEAEISVNVEAARRQPPARAKGSLLDLRV